MSKILCLSDIHGRKFWRKAIDNNIGNVDKIIFLGDYLDPYRNEFEENPDSMEGKDEYDSYNLTRMLNDIFSLKKNEPDKYILLTGNHTDSYIWSKFSAATRTDYENWEIYHKLFLENLNLFNFVWIENDVIFSHAGISNGWAYEFLSTYMKYDESALEGISYIKECSEVLKDTELKDFNIHYIKAISNISRYRGGDYIYGSCEWADLREHIDVQKSITEIIPIGEDGIYQIFGHTQLRSPLINNKWACLDCRKGFIVDTLTHQIVEA
jgi:hypothetical protein